MSLMDKLAACWEKMMLIRAGGADLYVDESGLVRGRAPEGEKLDAQTVRRGRDLQMRYNREAVWILKAEAEGRLHMLFDADAGDLLDLGDRIKRGDAQLLGPVKVSSETGLCDLVWIDRPEVVPGESRDPA